MGKYFQKKFRPNIINGDVSTVIQSDKTDLPFADKDLLFDWQPIDIPLGTDAIVSGIAHMYGEDGGVQISQDFALLIAKSNNGVAPTSLGAVNATIRNTASDCPELPDVLIGIMKFEADTQKAGILELASDSLYYWSIGDASGQLGPLAIEPENNSLSGSATTNRIFVAGYAGGGFDFSTGILADGAVTSDSATSITVKTVDPRKAFRVGDTVYLHDVDTALGTIASMTDTNITLNAAIAGGTDIADEDEFMNERPITITLGFRGR